MVVLLFFCCSLSISTIRQYPCVCVVHLLPGRLYDSSTLHVQFVHSFFEKRNAYTQFITLYTDMQLHCTVRNGSVHTSIFAFILPCQVDLFFVVVATSTLSLLTSKSECTFSISNGCSGLSNSNIVRQMQIVCVLSANFAFSQSAHTVYTARMQQSPVH